MAKKISLFFLFVLLTLLLCQAAVHANARRRQSFDEDEHEDSRGDRHRRHHDDDEDEDEEQEHGDQEEERHSPSPFILQKPVEIVKTQAGRIDVLPGLKDKGGPLALKNLGLNFVTMEPKALLLPQYIDAPFVLYVFKGKMRLGLVNGDDLQQQDMEEGDIFVVPGGLVFYMLNTDDAQRLRVFGMFDTSESLEKGHFQSVFVAGGTDPKSALAGFDRNVLSAVFKVSSDEVVDILGNQKEGPIVYTSKSRFLQLSAPLSTRWSLVNLASSFLFANYRLNVNDGTSGTKKPYNLLKKKPDFKNDNGQSVAVDGKEYSPLHKADVSLFAVSLKPAAVLAPHWNPRAAEIAVVTGGRGFIQVAYPNGTNALNKRVEEGTVFFVPRYFPMCQIASREGSFDFVGFSTSSRPNKPQFLAGSSSVLRALDMETMSTAYGLKEDRLRELVERQKDAIILPGFVEEGGQRGKASH